MLFARIADELMGSIKGRRLIGLTTAFVTTIILSYVYMSNKTSLRALNKQYSLKTLQRDVRVEQSHGIFYDDAIPNDVFYVWCAKRKYFEFRHYLSVRSVFRFLQPYRVVLYYEDEPADDNQRYHTWLQELKQQYPFFSTQKLDAPWCSSLPQSIDDHLFKNGGIFMREDIVLVQPLDDNYRLLSYVTFEEDTKSGSNNKVKLIQMARRDFKSAGDLSSDVHKKIKMLRVCDPISNSHIEDGTVRTLPKVSTNESSTDEDMDSSNVIPMFIIAESYVTPQAIWELDSLTGELLRLVAYNTTALVRPVPDYNRLAPNIAHVIWTNNDRMSFLFYLCVLSLLGVAHVDAVYLHGDGPPTGFYWDLIKGHPKLRLVRRRALNNKFERVYGTDVRQLAARDGRVACRLYVSLWRTLH
jgi:hypothetical protein